VIGGLDLLGHALLGIGGIDDWGDALVTLGLTVPVYLALMRGTAGLTAGEVLFGARYRGEQTIQDDVSPDCGMKAS